MIDLVARMAACPLRVVLDSECRSKRQANSRSTLALLRTLPDARPLLFVDGQSPRTPCRTERSVPPLGFFSLFAVRIVFFIMLISAIAALAFFVVALFARIWLVEWLVMSNSPQDHDGNPHGAASYKA